MSTTLAELEASANQLSALRAAMERLKEAKANLALLKRSAAERAKDMSVDWSWRPNLVLRAGDRYGAREITVKIEIPYGVAEQQLVYAVQKARREVIHLGGNPGAQP